MCDNLNLIQIHSQKADDNIALMEEGRRKSNHVLWLFVSNSSDNKWTIAGHWLRLT